jgi:hypothetical protein
VTENRKCPSCGLVNAPSRERCRRCDFSLKNADIFTRPMGGADTRPVEDYTTGRLDSNYGGGLTPSARPSPIAGPRYTPCPRCRGELLLVSESPNKGTGCIVVLLGFLFAPCIFGIFIVIYGFGMMNETKQQWHCRSCGTVYPA